MKPNVVLPINIAQFMTAVPPGRHYCFRERFQEAVPVSVTHADGTVYFGFQGGESMIRLDMMPMHTRILVDSSMVVHMPNHTGSPVVETELAFTPEAESLLQRMERTDMRKKFVAAPPTAKVQHMHCTKCRDRGWIPSVCLEGNYPLNSRVACDCQK